jgi:hypothetical protein
MPRRERSRTFFADAVNARQAESPDLWYYYMVFLKYRHVRRCLARNTTKKHTRTSPRPHESFAGPRLPVVFIQGHRAVKKSTMSARTLPRRFSEGSRLRECHFEDAEKAEDARLRWNPVPAAAARSSSYFAVPAGCVADAGHGTAVRGWNQACPSRQRFRAETPDE